MQDIGGPTLRQRLRRPSTLVFLGAGLLAADLLRRLAPWTDATLAALSLVLLLGALLARRPRPARNRETVAVLLPAASRPLCDPMLSRPAPDAGRLRWRLALFLLVVLALLLVPVAVARLGAPPPGSAVPLVAGSRLQPPQAPRPPAKEIDR
jgi:hypothetical protein